MSSQPICSHADTSMGNSPNESLESDLLAPTRSVCGKRTLSIRQITTIICSSHVRACLSAVRPPDLSDCVRSALPGHPVLLCAFESTTHLYRSGSLSSFGDQQRQPGDGLWVQLSLDLTNIIPSAWTASIIFHLPTHAVEGTGLC